MLGLRAIFGHPGVQNELRGTAMRQSATRELFTYWNHLRGERAAPDRAEIDPAAIRSVLSETFMLEVDDAHQFPLRLSGTRINALFCAEQKRRPFTELWSHNEARNMAAILLTVADASCPIIAGAAAAPEGYGEVEVELLFLPLRHGGETNARILGSLALTRKPPWLGLLPADRLMLRSLRTLNANVAPLAWNADLAIGPPAEVTPTGGGFEKRGRFRVYRGGR
jgi:hypothetical protein